MEAIYIRVHQAYYMGYPAAIVYSFLLLATFVIVSFVRVTAVREQTVGS
jgi:hypothetical protein